MGAGAWAQATNAVPKNAATSDLDQILMDSSSSLRLRV